jgi:oligopeptide/dipeptide ABC transporter ATP-binding protein
MQDLCTYFFVDEGILKAVDGVSLSVLPRKTLGIIGESGCGKSVTAQSILRIVPDPGRIVGGRILFRNRSGEVVDLASLDTEGARIMEIRGKDISMVFQEPMTSLSPVHTVGSQIEEALLLHVTQDKAKAHELSVDMLQRVGISNAEQRTSEYPYQLSGGLRQRAMIAMALSCNPLLLMADEPTTALDVTVQAQILELMRHLQEEMAMAILYITHDLGVISEISNEIAVMYLGKVVEFTTESELFRNPLHPYTRRLLKSIPRLGKKARERLDAIKGTVPIPMDLPRECGFFSRCPEAIAGTCDRAVPAYVEAEPGHHVRCFLYSSEVEAAEVAFADE